MELNKNERVEDLQCNGLKLIQNDRLYKFTTDSVLLANYAKAKRSDVVCEFCSGSGVISLLIQSKNKCRKIYEIEVQEEIALLAKRNVTLNGLDDVIEVLCFDAANAKKHIKQEVDVVVMNPPYFKGEGIRNDSETITKSRHEDTPLEILIKATSGVLKYGGKLYMVQSSDRLVDTIQFLRINNMEPKNIRFVQPKLSKQSHIFLLEAVKGGKPGIKISNPLILLTEDNKETLEVKEIYGRK